MLVQSSFLSGPSLSEEGGVSPTVKTDAPLIHENLNYVIISQVNRSVKNAGRNSVQFLEIRIMLKPNTIIGVALILLIVGGLNWGLVGLFKFDLVATIFGEMSILARLVYVAVAFSAIIILFPTFPLL